MSYVVYKELYNGGEKEYWYYGTYRTKREACYVAEEVTSVDSVGSDSIYGHVCLTKEAKARGIQNLPEEFYEEYRIKLVHGNCSEEYIVFDRRSRIEDCYEEAKHIIEEWQNGQTIPVRYSDCETEEDIMLRCFQKHFNVEVDDREIMTFVY